MSKKRKLFKKFLSFVLALMLILPPVSQVTMAVINAAENVADNETIYEHDGYIVVYKVVSEWEGHKAVEVTLKNTSVNSISNWAVSMENTGEITGLWNAVLSAADADKYIVKCVDYNNTIPAGQSVTFGYTLVEEEEYSPADIYMCMAESELTEGFSIDYKVTDDWGNGFQGEIKIVNESKVAIEGWKLNFKGNFDVLDYWNCGLTKSTDGMYTLTHTEWQNVIPAGGEYVIGFVGSKTDDEMIIDDIKMVTAGYGREGGEVPTEPVATEPATEPEITEPVTSAPEINWDDETDTDGDGLPDVYEIHMFNTNPENTDTDADGLPDGYELLNLGTDPVGEDSDNDGITDGKEDSDGDGLDNLAEYGYGTNPTNSDSDYDGLGDRKELEEYGTDPSDYDTDDDGISDGDEIELGLDPLNLSTNGVPDGEYTIEQTIGVDSEVLEDVNTSTENPFEISLEVKATGLAEKNLTVQGTTENPMFQNESYVGELITIDYSDSMKLESISINFTMDASVIENELNLFGDEAEELKGIKRFNVFKFVEEVNMLLPIETFHDVENNTVYTVTDDDGMYYLVDMEKWLYELEMLSADQEANAANTISVMSVNRIVNDETVVRNSGGMTNPNEEGGIWESLNQERTPVLFSFRDEWLDESKEMEKDERPIDIVFVMQSECIWSVDYERLAGALVEGWTRLLSDKYVNLRVCVLNRTKNDTYFIGENPDTPQWFKSETEFVKYLPGYYDYTVDEQYLSRDYLAELSDSEAMGYRKDAAKFVIDLQYGNNQMPFYYFQNCMEMMKEQGIVFAEVQEIEEAYGYSTASIRSAIESTGGKLISNEDYTIVWGVPDFVDEVMSRRVEPQTKFKAIVATGYEEITLDEPLRDGSSTDTDEDTLTDWDEVYTEMLNWDVYGNVVLPSLKLCIDNACEKSYVVDGLARFRAANTPAGMPSNIYESYIEEILEKTYVLPIHTDPTRVDSDDDGLLDATYIKKDELIVAPKDIEPLKYNGKANLWKKHIASVNTGERVASGYSEIYYGIREFQSYVEQKWGAIYGWDASLFELFSTATSMIGSVTLDFRYDDKYIALHSDKTQWQSAWGYNDFYDWVFDTFTSMNRKKIYFEFYEKEYVVWVWKGNYLNLGPGAEVGVYKKHNSIEEITSLEHWVVDMQFPMTLSLYKDIGAGEYSTYYNWAPDMKQWWITGFVPDIYDYSVNAEEVYAIASVDFSDNVDMYEWFVKTYKGRTDSDIVEDNIILDDNLNLVWIMW